MTLTKETTDDRPQGRPSGYLSVLRSPGMAAWFAAVVCQRLPIAMAPLALVLLGREVTGSFSVGALLAGAFALAEAAAAGVMGRRFDRRPAGPELRLVLAVQAVALLALVGVSRVLDGAVVVIGMVVLAALAGAVASGAHGGLRALVVRSVSQESQHSALGLEASMTALMWAVGPAVIGALAFLGGPAVSLAVTAGVAGVGVLVAGALVDPGRAATDPGHGDSVWRLSWPAMTHEAAVLLTVGAAYTALPALLERLGGDADLSGLALGGFAVAGIAGGIVYGGRRWPASYHSQTTVLILVLCAMVLAAAVAGTVPLVIALLLVGGFASTPALTARGAGLQQMLPESQWSAGFSGLYAAGGIGFGLAGLVVAPLLASVGPHVALAACALLAAGLTVVGTIAESRLTRIPATRPAPTP
ncbi:MFS transporter [Micromonospora profundi]|uniref:MFS transporter n=1 Tax=Micromonospora profundi TaxID=1420889 RepID=UPI0033A7CDD2